MANTNYIQLVQVIILLFIGPLSTFDMRQRGLTRADAAWCGGPDFSAIAAGVAAFNNICNI